MAQRIVEYSHFNGMEVHVLPITSVTQHPIHWKVRVETAGVRDIYFPHLDPDFHLQLLKEAIDDRNLLKKCKMNHTIEETQDVFLRPEVVYFKTF